MPGLDGNDRRRALDAVFAACAETNGQLPADQRLEATETTVIIGDDGVLDSLGVLNFLMTLEGRLEDDAGWTVTLVGDEALAAERITLGDLADLVTRRVADG